MATGAGIDTAELSVLADDGVALAGTLVIPPGRARAPVVVALHGASDGLRGARLLEDLASVLPALGIGVLLFDRRGEGASQGVAGASFERLAGDGECWLRWLRAHPRVEPRGLGLWGHSQGAWIAALVAARSPADFLIAVSPCGVSPARQMEHAAALRLAAGGHSRTAVERALDVRRRADDCHRRRPPDHTQALALRDSVRGEPWFELAMLPDPADPAHHAWSDDLDFDVAPVLRSLRLRALVLFGADDRWVPLAQSRAIWAANLRPEPAIEVLEGAGHWLTCPPGPDDGPDRGSIHPGYHRALARWVTPR